MLELQYQSSAIKGGFEHSLQIILKFINNWNKQL